MPTRDTTALGLSSLRSIGVGRRQACAGDDSRLPILSGEPYFYDSSRLKTLSMRTLTLDAASLATAGAGYMMFPGGVIMAAGLGWAVPYDVTLVELIAWKGLALGALTIEVHDDTVSVGSLVIADGVQVASSTSTNIDIAAGSLIHFYATGAIAVGCGIKAICRRRI